MNEKRKNSKLRFSVFDAVIIIIIAALAASLVFRYTADKKLFVYDTEKYTVTVRASGIQYSTVDFITSGAEVYFTDSTKLGTIASNPSLTPALKYFVASSGDLIPSYYPDNTLVDITAEIECELIMSNGMLMTKSGTHISSGAKLELHTVFADLNVEIVSVNKLSVE